MESRDKDLIETLIEYQKDIKKKTKDDKYWKIKNLNERYYDPRTLKQISKLEEDSTARKVKMKKNTRLLKMI